MRSRGRDPKRIGSRERCGRGVAAAMRDPRRDETTRKSQPIPFEKVQPIRGVTSQADIRIKIFRR